jgi:hypothetical protein
LLSTIATLKASTKMSSTNARAIMSLLSRGRSASRGLAVLGMRCVSSALLSQKQTSVVGG